MGFIGILGARVIQFGGNWNNGSNAGA